MSRIHFDVGDYCGSLTSRPDGAGDLTGEQRTAGSLPGVSDWYSVQEALGVGMSGIPEHLLA